jgi:extradiol dioxygenase family protein
MRQFGLIYLKGKITIPYYPASTDPRYYTLRKTLVMLLELKTLWCQRADTQKGRDNLNKAISFDQKGASTYSLELSSHVRTKWSTVAFAYVPDTVVPAPHLGFVQVKDSQSFSIG